jgi:[acyl-carrier-protein] S-malonyltransferase
MQPTGNISVTNRSAPTQASALLFAGQGSQDSAMRELAQRHCPALLSQAIERLGCDPFEHIEEGTLYMQPALYCGTLAHWREAGEPRAEFAAGHSLGELAALTAAGYLDPSEGMRLVLERAIAMDRAAGASEPGGLMAVLGPQPLALEICQAHQLTVAADNEPSQMVLSGPLDRLQRARTEARGRGLKAVLLRVPLALHSPAMEPALAPYERALRGVELGCPRMTVIANLTARPFTDVRGELARAMISPVRWRESVLTMNSAGVGSYHEMGSSEILSGLVQRTLADAAEQPVEL